MQILDLTKLGLSSAQAELEDLDLSSPATGYLVKSKFPLRRGLKHWQSPPTDVLDDGERSAWVPIIWGPAVYHWCYPLKLMPIPEGLADWENEHLRLLSCYSEALASPEAAQRYGQAIAKLFAWEEKVLFPSWQAYLGDARLCRELGYEQAGVRRALERFPELVERNLRQQATRKEMETLELDLHHLLEHHWERKQAMLGCYSKLD
jgi:hypothetical protein